MITLGVIAKNHSVGFQSLVNDALTQPCIQQVVVALDDDVEPGIEGYRSDRVTYFEWPLNMNFAAMRNAVCARATQPWILFMDTDENLKPCCWAMLPHWTKFGVDLLLLPRCNYYLLDDGRLDGPINFPDWQPRLHRQHVRWSNAVHEWPIGPLNSQHLPAEHNFAIQHIKTHLDQHLANRLYANIQAMTSQG